MAYDFQGSHFVHRLFMTQNFKNKNKILLSEGVLLWESYFYMTQNNPWKVY